MLSSVWNLVYAVGIGLVIASLMFMKKIGDLTSERSEMLPLNEQKWSDEIDFPKTLTEEVFIKHVNGPLFFGSTSDFVTLSKQLPHTANTVVLRLGKMHYMDQSGLFAMEDVLLEMRDKNLRIVFVGLNKQTRYMMEKIDIIPDVVPEHQIFKNFRECLIWVKGNVRDVV